MRVSMMLLIVLVVFTSLATAKPFFQSNRRCRGGTSWPADDECNTCTCRNDGKSYACTTSSCKSINSLHSRVDEAEGLVQPNNNQDQLQALDALAESNSDHGQWIPFDISQYMSSFN